MMILGRPQNSVNAQSPVGARFVVYDDRLAQALAQGRDHELVRNLRVADPQADVAGVVDDDDDAGRVGQGVFDGGAWR